MVVSANYIKIIGVDFTDSHLLRSLIVNLRNKSIENIKESEWDLIADSLLKYVKTSKYISEALTIYDWMGAPILVLIELNTNLTKEQIETIMKMVNGAENSEHPCIYGEIDG